MTSPADLIAEARALVTTSDSWSAEHCAERFHPLVVELADALDDSLKKCRHLEKSLRAEGYELERQAERA